MFHVVLDVLTMFPQFYCEEHVSIGERYARFAFCKDLDTLQHAARRLEKLGNYLGRSY